MARQTSVAYSSVTTSRVVGHQFSAIHGKRQALPVVEVDGVALGVNRDDCNGGRNSEGDDTERHL